MNVRIYLSEWVEKISVPPLVPWTIFFCLGIIFEKYLSVSMTVLFIGVSMALFGGVLFLKKRKIAHLFIFSIAFLLGAIVFENSKVQPLSSIIYCLSSEKQTVFVRGIIVSEPSQTVASVSFDLKVKEIRKNSLFDKASGRVFCLVHSPRDFAYGDEVVLQGSLYRPFGLFKKKNCDAILNVKKSGFVKRLSIRKGNGLVQFSMDLKRYMARIIARHMDPFSTLILNGILLGEQGKEMSFVRDRMVKTGTWHIMVVSGSHTGLLAFIFLVFFKMLRVPRLLRFGLTMALLVIYCLLTGASNPIVRSTVMTLFFLSTYVMQRNPSFFNIMALAALVILSFDPEALFNVGFQLSFVSVIFIVGLYARFQALFSDFCKFLKWKKGGFLSPLLNCFIVSFSAWLGTAPLLAHAFGNFSLIAVFANMVIVPLAMVIVNAGFVLLFFGSFAPGLAQILAPAIKMLIFLLFKANDFFETIPHAFYAFTPIPLYLVFCCYGLYILIFILIFRKAKKTKEVKAFA